MGLFSLRVNSDFVSAMFFMAMEYIACLFEVFFHKGKFISAGCFSYPALRVLTLVFPFVLAALDFFFSSFNPARARHSSSVISCGFLLAGMRKNFFPDWIHGPYLPFTTRTRASSFHDLMILSS